MNFSLASKRRALVIAGIALLGFLFGGIVYLATVNPPWSPINQFKGDGRGTSHAEQEKQAAAKAKEEAEERLTGALRFIPQDVVLVSHANLSAVESGKQWWDNYTNMLPPHYTLPADLPEELGVSSLTYTVVVTPSEEYSHENPFSYAMIMSLEPGKRDEALAYFAEHTEGNFYNHYVESEGTGYLVLAETYLYEEVDGLVNDQQSDVSFAALEREYDFTVDAPTPTMFVDFSAYLGTLTAYQPDKTEFINSLMNEGIGMADNTTWLGTSSDQGITWTGEFLTGGIDREKIDPEEFKQALGREIELIFAEDPIMSEDGSTVLDYGYAVPGMSTLEDGLSIAKGSKHVGQILNPHDVNAERVQAQAEDDEIVISFSPQMLQGTFQSALKPSSIKTVTIRVKEEGSTIEFDYYEDDDFAITEVPEPVEEEEPVSD